MLPALGFLRPGKCNVFPWARNEGQLALYPRAGKRFTPRRKTILRAGDTMAKAKPFDWRDPFELESQLTEDERLAQASARAYAHDRLAPRARKMFRDESADPDIFREMGELGFLGPTISPEFGGAGMGYVAYGVIAREIERVDSGFRSMMSVQSSLVMTPIEKFGSLAQKKAYLPKLATGEWIGCFGLTEPDHGSDPGAMVTRAKTAPGGYVLNGAKLGFRIRRSPIFSWCGRRRTMASSEVSSWRRAQKA